MMEAEWARQLVQLAGWGFLIVMLLTGRLVPRWFYDELKTALDRETEARKKAEELGTAALTAAKAAQQAMEALRDAASDRKAS